MNSEEKNIYFDTTRIPTHSRSLLWGELFFGVFVPLLVFFSLGIGIGKSGGFQWDASVLDYIHHYATPQRDQLMMFLTYLGEVWILIPIAIAIAVLFAFTQRLREAGFLLLVAGGAAILNVVLKVLFHRVRPDLWTPLSPEFDYGFPSGHSMLTMALALALVVLLWHTRWRWPVIVAGGLFVLAVGLSRLYLGVHFLSDVLAAWSVTIAWVLGLTLYSGQRKFTVFILRTESNTFEKEPWAYISGGEDDEPLA